MFSRKFIEEGINVYIQVFKEKQVVIVIYFSNNNLKYVTIYFRVVILLLFVYEIEFKKQFRLYI